MAIQPQDTLFDELVIMAIVAGFGLMVGVVLGIIIGVHLVGRRTIRTETAPTGPAPRSTATLGRAAPAVFVLDPAALRQLHAAPGAGVPLPGQMYSTGRPEVTR